MMNGGLWKGGISLRGNSMRGPVGRAPLLGTPKDMLRLYNGCVSIGPPLWGNMEGRSFLRDYEMKRYFKRDVKMPCKRISLHSSPVGQPGGDSLAGIF